MNETDSTDNGQQKTEVEGGATLSGQGESNIGGDMTGRDKITAGGHYIHAEAGAAVTVIIQQATSSEAEHKTKQEDETEHLANEKAEQECLAIQEAERVAREKTEKAEPERLLREKAQMDQLEAEEMATFGNKSELMFKFVPSVISSDSLVAHRINLVIVNRSEKPLHRVSLNWALPSGLRILNDLITSCDRIKPNEEKTLPIEVKTDLPGTYMLKVRSLAYRLDGELTRHQDLSVPISSY